MSNKIKLSGNKGNGFTPISEGWHVFKIDKVEYKAKFGKMNITLITQDGEKHFENYSLIDSKGNINEGANNAFSFFARTALDDFTVDEIDPDDLVGRYIRAEVVHNVVESTKKKGETVTFANLDGKEPATGFDDEDQVEDEVAEDIDDLTLDDLF